MPSSSLSHPANQPITTQSAAIRGAAQPNLNAWNKVQIGMTEEEVVELLGPPKSKPFAEHVDVTDPIKMYLWKYGELQFPSDAFPAPMEYQLYFTQRRVTMIEDPFGHVATGIGPPAAPKLLCPFNGAAFGHFPRYLDLRWRPSPGDDIEYEVEVQIEQFGDSGRGFIPLDRRPLKTKVPYLAYEFAGAQTGQWRVRARNKNGVGDWSELRTFAFGV